MSAPSNSVHPASRISLPPFIHRNSSDRERNGPRSRTLASRVRTFSESDSPSSNRRASARYTEVSSLERARKHLKWRQRRLQCITMTHTLPFVTAAHIGSAVPWKPTASSRTD
ncbi:hypothetical protein MRX96_044700 [Rhipicephalus microplus]